MPSTISSPVCVVRCQHESKLRWFTLAIGLNMEDEFEQLLSHSGRLLCRVDGADPLAASYLLENWESAIKSGAYYAFRKLGSSPQPLLLSELQGRLHSDDMDALAGAAARAVTKLIGGETSGLSMPEWETTDEICAAPRIHEDRVSA